MMVITLSLLKIRLVTLFRLLLLRNKVYIIANNKVVNNVVLNSTRLTSLSIGDVNQSGENNIVFVNNGKLDVRNFAGVLSDNFPFELQYWK